MKYVSKKSVQQTPAELMHEMLKRAKRGDTKAQKEIMQLMTAMQGCMEADESEKEADDDWSPKRESQMDERMNRPTPPTRPLAKATTKTTTTKETKKIDMYKVSIDQIDDSSAGALQNSLLLHVQRLSRAQATSQKKMETRQTIRT